METLVLMLSSMFVLLLVLTILLMFSSPQRADFPSNINVHADLRKIKKQISNEDNFYSDIKKKVEEDEEELEEDKDEDE